MTREVQELTHIAEKDGTLPHGFLKYSYDTKEMPCQNINYSCAIDSEGNVYPCNSFFYKIGNLKEMTIKEIWEKSSVLSDVQKIRNFELKKCNNCSLVEHCFRCPGFAYSEEGDLLECSQTAKERAIVRKSIYERRMPQNDLQ